MRLSNRIRSLGGSTNVVGLGSLVLVAVAAVGLASAHLSAPWNQYDDGISASAGTFLAHGLFPYRDFWLLYGPLSGYLVALASIAFGPSLMLLHVLGIAIAAAQAAAGFALLKRASPPLVAATCALAATVLPMLYFNVVPQAWTLSMALATCGIAIGTSPSRSRNSSFGTGFLIGLAFLSRQDLGAYALISILVVVRDRRILWGFASLVVPWAALLLAEVPWPGLYEQLVWFPLVGQRLFRAASIVSLDPTDLAVLIAVWPVVVVPRLVLLGALGTVLWRRASAAMVSVLIFAALCQLQTTGRGDAPHFAEASTPTILLLGLLVSSFRIRAVRLGGVAIAGWLIAIPSVVGIAAYGGAHDSRETAVEAATRFVVAHTRTDDHIFVGLTTNRYTYSNPLLVYFIADRPPGTRYTMFNPGVTNTAETQLQMTKELEDSRTRYLVLDRDFASVNNIGGPPGEEGASVLDTYIASRFAVEADFGNVIVLVHE